MCEVFSKCLPLTSLRISILTEHSEQAGQLKRLSQHINHLKTSIPDPLTNDVQFYHFDGEATCTSISMIYCSVASSITIQDNVVIVYCCIYCSFYLTNINKITLKTMKQINNLAFSITKFFLVQITKLSLGAIFNGVHLHRNPHRILCFESQTRSCTCSNRSGSIPPPCCRSSISCLQQD